jgi:hypothetical protein
MLIDKFEFKNKVEESGGESEVLEDDLDHAEGPGGSLGLCTPEGPASERAFASKPAGLRRCSTQKADFAPLRSRLFANSKPCSLHEL